MKIKNRRDKDITIEDDDMDEEEACWVRLRTEQNLIKFTPTEWVGHFHMK